MKDITKKNAEKIAHNIHKKLDNIVSAFKWQNKPMYRIEKATIGAWITFKIIPEQKDFITGSAMDSVRDLALKYMRSYNGIFYMIGILREYSEGKQVIKPTYEINIEIK